MNTFDGVEGLFSISPYYCPRLDNSRAFENICALKGEQRVALALSFEFALGCF